MSRFRKAQIDARFKAKNKIQGLSPPAIETPTNPLVWEHWTNQDELKNVDLSIFQDGDEKQIIGRPRLILELAPVIRSRTFGKSLGTINVALGRIKKFFQFLTWAEQEQGRVVSSCIDLTSEDGHNFRRFLLTGSVETLKEKQRHLNYIRTCADIVRQSEGEALLLWPIIENEDGDQEHQDVDPRALKAVFFAAKRVFDDSLRQHARGVRALQLGTDPRTIVLTRDTDHINKRNSYHKNAAWYRWRNILVLISSRVCQRFLSKEDIKKSDLSLLSNSRTKLRVRAQKVGCEESCLPTATIETLYRMIAPSVNDTTAAYALVSIHTGWMDTARAIIVVDDAFEESDDWYSERTCQLTRRQDKRGTVAILAPGEEMSEEGDQDEVDIKAIRPKTKRLHSALSLKHSKYHPYSVIKAQIERTRFLRDLLRQERMMLLAKTQTSEIRAEIGLIERKLRSPWIYYNSRGKGQNQIGLFGETAVAAQTFISLKSHAIEWAERRSKDSEAIIEAIKVLRPGDIRDGYAAFIYNVSGNNIFSVQGLLNHRSIATTRHYLRQTRQIRELFRKHCVLAGAILRETKNGRAIDPTIFRIETITGVISENDRQVLKIYRAGRGFRGRFGMGCSDPFAPPAIIVPNHLAGAICPAQRCLLCPH